MKRRLLLTTAIAAGGKPMGYACARGDCPWTARTM